MLTQASSLPVQLRWLVCVGHFRKSECSRIFSRDETHIELTWKFDSTCIFIFYSLDVVRISIDVE